LKDTTTFDTRTVNKETITWLLFALALALAPHVLRLPPIISVFCILFGIWRLMAAHYDWHLPATSVRTVLTLAAITGLYLSFGTLFGRDAGFAMLAIMLGLKLLEMHTVRDTMLVIFLGYFLGITTVIYTQTIAIAMYMLAVALIITTVLIDLNQYQHGQRIAFNLRLAGKMFVQALPLMLVMFVLFPRVPGPLWGLPEDAHSGHTGLSDSMSFGTISNLSRSDAVAFRAKFDGSVPDASLRYWRGPVLWYTDGKNWRPAANTLNKNLLPPQIKFEGMGDPLKYTVTLEPHNKNWLYALDLPATIPPHSHMTRDYQLHAEQPVTSLKRYEMTSYPNYQANTITMNEWLRALQLPTDTNPRTQALGKSWAETYKSKIDIVRHALQYFNQEPFSYTLNPPLLGKDPIDEFLFSTRKGFCEHYAASFTVLMRAAGIPTRVVTGYQGGEYNPLGDYLIIRQSDAHAWTEVWLKNSGWMRIDPTAAVAPERVEQGIDSALAGERDSEKFRLFHSDALAAILQRMSYSWDAVNNVWNQWVLGYGATLQSEFLSGLGIKSWKGMTVWLMIGLGIIIFGVAVLMLVSVRGNHDPVLREYLRFCNKLGRRGIQREAAEGPVDFATRVSALRPDLADQINIISKLYTALRYGDHFTLPRLRRLRHRVSAFHP
jgi:transglutaminase-like putative cysteine protease